MKQLVSILIPAFNAEKWIGKCIESALAQTWPRKEIIVVDDGSKDSTLKVAKSYASKLVRVKTQDNRGGSTARNHALSLAQGDYIQWLDADDLLAPDKISVQLVDTESGQSSQVLLSGSWGKFEYRPENSNFEPDLLWENLQPLEWLFRKLDGNMWMAIESWLVSRRLTEMAGPWDEALSLDDDGEYFCRVLACTSRIQFIPAARCYCLRGNVGISSNFCLSNSKLESLMISIFSHVRTLRAMEDSPRTRNACLKYLKRNAVYFYPERPDLFKKLQLMAGELGGQLCLPELRPKYQLIKRFFGWKIAKKAQHTFPTLRSIARKNWEGFCNRVGQGSIDKDG